MTSRQNDIYKKIAIQNDKWAKLQSRNHLVYLITSGK